MSTDRQDFIDAMRRFPGAANIVSTGSGDERAGFTATACMSLTADPPQIGIAVNRSVSAYPKLVANRSFCINTVASDQHPLAARFAGPIKGAARFEEGSWTTLVTGSPVLEGAVVNLDCEVATTLELSTHTLFVGKVVAARQRTDARSLLYVDGDWASLLPASGGDVGALLKSIHQVTEVVDKAADRSADPLLNLEHFVKEWTEIYVDQKAAAQKFMSAELYVSPTDLQTLGNAQREFDDRLTAMLSEGVKQGRLHVGDARLTAFAISGMVGWTHRWFKPDGRLTPAQIGEHLAMLAHKMVAPVASDAKRAPDEQTKGPKS
ncbi:MAG: flavin reductase [Burkholderiaceae bacterium]|nr:flavin reductase [Burkholderiaceae bacterium]